MRNGDVYANGFDEETGNQPPTNECPDCDGQLRTSGGETRCRACGLILEEHRLDHRGPRILDEDDADSKRRTGAPLTEGRHDRGLSTEIGRNHDGRGQTLSQSKRRRLNRLRREHTRAKWQSTQERNLAHGCTEIARLVSALELPRSIREQASSLFRTAQNADLLPGRSIEAFAGACVYAACRCMDHTRTLDTIAEAARRDRDKVAKTYRVLNRELDLPVPPRQPAEFIPGQASQLDIPRETERVAREIAEQSHEDRLSIGSNPAGFAAACLEVAAAEHGVHVRQIDLADVADVTPVTVRTNREVIREEYGRWS